MKFRKGSGDDYLNQHLIIFTIGPVQSFIAQARKTQDLYAGSYLLSHLTDFAIKDLKKQLNDATIIFPDESIKSKPNRFIAKIECENPETIGKDLEKKVIGEFNKISETILENLKLDIPDGFDTKFRRQINDFLSIYWVILPFDNENNYAAAFGELESYLGAVKNVRHFNQLKEEGRKCSLCGERDVLFDRGKRKANVHNAVSLNNYPLKYMADGENICGVCFTKRLSETYFRNGHNYVIDYPSVAAISLMDSLNKLDETLLNNYRDIFEKNFDDQLFFEENLKKAYFIKYKFPVDKLEKAKSKLREIRGISKENNTGIKFPKYYAIISLDGDSMGKWLSGQNLVDKTELLDFHGKLTQKLGSYSDNVEKSIIKSPRGKLVYAGGDDVLAFINLNHLFSVLNELRVKFPDFEKIKPVKDNKISTASCGICIAHYKTPLSEALNWSRKMEKEAKAIDNKKEDKSTDKEKDAFAIAVLKRSGEINKAVFKWNYKEVKAANDIKTLDVLIDLINLLKPKDSTAIQQLPQLSDTFIKNLDLEFRRLMDEKGIFQDDTDGNIFKIEMKRLIERSFMLKSKPDETREVFNERKKNQINRIVTELSDLYGNSKSLLNFLSFLHIANFIEKEMN